MLRVLPGKRLVCFGQWLGDQVVAKLFLDSEGGKRHVTREERGISALSAAGIKTPALLLKGNLTSDGTPILCFRRILAAQNLGKAWKQAAHDSQRGELLSRTLAVIAKQHQAGLKQDDPHLGNFLLAEEDIYTIDGAAVDIRQIGKPLSKAQSLRNLGLFFAQLNPRFDRLAANAFEIYAEQRQWPLDKRLRSQLLKEICSQRNHRKKRYLTKIYRECSDFVCRKAWDFFLVCDRSFYHGSAVPFLTNPDPFLDADAKIKDGNTSTVALVDMDGQRLVVKRYNIKNPWHAMTRAIRPSRAWISWRNSHRLNILGIPTPKPVALLEKRWGPFRYKAYFVTEYVSGMDAHGWFHSDLSKKKDAEDLVKQFRKLLQSLADASISHGDLKATNFIVTSQGLCTTDLDAMCEHRFRWQFVRAFRQDLDRLRRNWATLPQIDEMFREQLALIQL
jgi:tRNA A-37 threonylcarbamoyl transferase component Bud32